MTDRYYADLEYNKCYSLPGGMPDLKNHGNACIVWRRFANLFETSQSLFWASFGLVSLTDFELTGQETCSSHLFIHVTCFA